MQVNRRAPVPVDMAPTCTDDDCAKHYETIVTRTPAPTYEQIVTPPGMVGTSTGGGLHCGRDRPDCGYRLETAGTSAESESLSAADYKGPQKPSSSSAAAAAAAAASVISGVSDETSIYDGTATTLVDNALYDL